MVRSPPGYPGGLRTRTATQQWEKDPCQILLKAVSGMLPKNKSREVRQSTAKRCPPNPNALRATSGSWLVVDAYLCA
jgi:hypothetical protein